MSLTYPHLESPGLMETVGGCEDVELIQDGAPTEPLIVFINEQSLRPEQNVCRPPMICESPCRADWAIWALGGLSRSLL